MVSLLSRRGDGPIITSKSANYQTSTLTSGKITETQSVFKVLVYNRKHFNLAYEPFETLD